MQPTNLFLVMRDVVKRDGHLNFKAKWYTSHGELYASKPCATEAEAVKLARAWLAKQPAGRYADTTRKPERLGYSLGDA